MSLLACPLLTYLLLCPYWRVLNFCIYRYVLTGMSLLVCSNWCVPTGVSLLVCHYWCVLTGVSTCVSLLVCLNWCVPNGVFPFLTRVPTAAVPLPALFPLTLSIKLSKVYELTVTHPVTKFAMFQQNLQFTDVFATVCLPLHDKPPTHKFSYTHARTHTHTHNCCPLK
jgi:hypothetical protein